LGRKSDHALDNFEAHGLRNFNSNGEPAAMRQGAGQLSENGIAYTDKYNTNASYAQQKAGPSGDSMGHALASDAKDGNPAS
jgi:hypothetical protein